MKLLFIITTILIIIIIVAIMFSLYKILYYFNTITSICNKPPEYFVYSGKLPGPTILILGATHGNEPAGYYAIKSYMNKLNSQKITLKKGKIIFVPAVNYCGLKLNTRKVPILGDINRFYNYNGNHNQINSLIVKLVNKSDFIIDLHEGSYFNKLDKKSVGSTITPLNTSISNDVAKYVKLNLNKNITQNYKKFDIMTPNIKDHSLRHYVSNYNNHNKYNNITKKKNYILVEVTGKFNAQPLEIRKKQGLVVISSVVSYFDMESKN